MAIGSPPRWPIFLASPKSLQKEKDSVTLRGLQCPHGEVYSLGKCKFLHVPIGNMVLTTKIYAMLFNIKGNPEGLPFVVVTRDFD